MRWLGGTTVGFCEIEDYPRRVLAKNFPGVPIHDDIHTLTGDIVDGWGGCDLITGGFPCQPYSVAGERRGNEDDRALWPQMARVIDECRPTYVLAENVPGIVTLALDGVLADLESLGYTARTVGVPACAVDAPHRRGRVWIVAHTYQERPQRRKQEPAIEWSGNSTSIRAFASDKGMALNPASHPAGQRLTRPGQHEQPIHPASSGIGQATQLVDGSKGFPWPTEPGVGRVANGIPDGVDRVKALGNAIVPAVAYEIIRVMLEEH